MVSDKTDLHEEDKGGENEGIAAEGRETEGEELKTKKMSVEKSAQETVNEHCKENGNDAPNTTYLVTFALLYLNNSIHKNHSFFSRLSGSSYECRDSKKAGRSSWYDDQVKCTHLIHSFKVVESDDVVMVAIPAKERAVNDPLRIEAKNIGTLHENRYRLQTEYGVSENF